MNKSPDAPHTTERILAEKSFQADVLRSPAPSDGTTSWVMIAGRRSKTVAFVAILALTTFGALATASAQPADIKAIDKAFQDHYARGNYPAAQIDAQELERLVKARFGADHAYYAVALNKLGIVVQAQGKYTEAEGLFKRALAIREKALGANHPDVGQTLNNLAIVYRDQGKYGEAEGLLQARVGDPRKSARCEPPRRGPDPQQSGHRVSSPGQVQRRPRSSSSARWSIREKALGASHPDVGADPQQPAASCIETRANTARRRGSTSAPWRSAKKR